MRREACALWITPFDAALEMARIAEFIGHIEHSDKAFQRQLGRAKVAALKKAAALPLNDKDREQEVLEHVRQANTGPLDERSVSRLFRRIIRESRRAQVLALQEDAAALAHEVIR